MWVYKQLPLLAIKTRGESPGDPARTAAPDLRLFSCDGMNTTYFRRSNDSRSHTLTTRISLQGTV